MKNNNLFFKIFAKDSIVLDISTREILKVICPCKTDNHHSLLILQKEDGTFVNRDISLLCLIQATFNSDKHLSKNCIVEGVNPDDTSFGKKFVIQDFSADFVLLIEIPNDYYRKKAANPEALKKDLDWIIKNSKPITLPLCYLKII